MKIIVMSMDGTSSSQKMMNSNTVLGKRIPLEVEPTDTVDTVRRMIEKIEGTSPGNDAAFLTDVP